MNTHSYSHITMQQVPPGYMLVPVGSVQDANANGFLVNNEQRMEEQESSDAEELANHLFYCSICNDRSEEPCWEHSEFVRDHLVDLSAITLPECLYFDHKPTMADKGVFARDPIPVQTVFGPLIAPIRKTFGDDTTLALPFSDLGKKDAVYFDLHSDHACNWMKFVRFAETRAQQNVAVCIRDTDIHFVTIREIVPQEEMRVAFSEKYASVLDEAFLQERVMPFGADPEDIPQTQEIAASSTSNETSPELTVSVQVKTPQKSHSSRRTTSGVRKESAGTASSSKQGRVPTHSQAVSRPQTSSAKKSTGFTSVVPLKLGSRQKSTPVISTSPRQKSSVISTSPRKPQSKLGASRSAANPSKDNETSDKPSTYGLRSKRSSDTDSELFLDTRGKPMVFKVPHGQTSALPDGKSPKKGLELKAIKRLLGEAVKKKKLAVVNATVEKETEILPIPIRLKSRNSMPTALSLKRKSEASERVVKHPGKKREGSPQMLIRLFGHNIEDDSEEDEDWAPRGHGSSSSGSSLSKDSVLSSDMDTFITSSERAFPVKKRRASTSPRKPNPVPAPPSGRTAALKKTRKALHYSPEIERVVNPPSRHSKHQHDGSEEM